MKDNRITIKKPLDYVIPNIEDWPIYKAYNDNEEFLEKVKGKVLQHLSWLYSGEDNTLRKELRTFGLRVGTFKKSVDR